MLSAIEVVAQQAPSSGLSWWETVVLFAVVPALVLAVIAAPVLLMSRRRTPPTFPRLAPGTVHANGASQQEPSQPAARPQPTAGPEPTAPPPEG